jgi:hypothetical protein
MNAGGAMFSRRKDMGYRTTLAALLLLLDLFKKRSVF